MIRYHMEIPVNPAEVFAKVGYLVIENEKLTQIIALLQAKVKELEDGNSE